MKKALYTLIVFLFLTQIHFLLPQPVEECIEVAKIAEAEDRWTDTRSGRFNAGIKKVEAKEYQKAKHTIPAKVTSKKPNQVAGSVNTPQAIEDPDGDHKSEFTAVARSTGQTTGNIANLSLENKSSAPLTIFQQMVYIPSSGKYQPYIAKIPGTIVPPKTTVNIPITGYCADVHKPPVAAGDGMPPIEDWVATVPDVQPTPGSGGINVVEKIVPQFTVKDIPAITNSPGFTPKPPPAVPAIQPTWPGSEILVGGTMNPEKGPESLAPILIEALNNIANAYDKLRGEGKITTPFSGDPEKERESVIQQTIWIYTAGLTGKEYTRENFEHKVIEQFETNTGTKVTSIPEQEKKKLDAGVDDFWKLFVATGVEAKVLKNVPDENMDDPELINEGGVGVTITDELTRAEKFDKKLNTCFFNKLTYSVSVTHSYTDSKTKKTVKDTYGGNAKNEIEIKLKGKDTLDVDLKDVTCQCLCWTRQDKDGTKHGSDCPCIIIGITLTAFDAKFLTDQSLPELDKLATDSLRAEIQKKHDDLDKNGGKKSEIEKLKKQLDDEKELIKKNKERLAELKKVMEGKWRLKRTGGEASFLIPKAFTGPVEVIFTVHGVCEEAVDCKGCSWSRVIKIMIIGKK